MKTAKEWADGFEQMDHGIDADKHQVLRVAAIQLDVLESVDGICNGPWTVGVINQLRKEIERGCE